MNYFEREQLKDRACQLSEVSCEEFNSALAHYRQAVGGMWRIPDYFFDIGVVIGISLAMFYSQWWIRIVGFVICLFGASHIGTRMGNLDGFRNGYVRGKRAGTWRALGTPEGEDIEKLKQTRELIAERCE